MKPAPLIESPLTPIEVCDALSACRLLALIGVNVACAELDRIALETDTPDWRDIDAANYLDAVHKLLARSVAT